MTREETILKRTCNSFIWNYADPKRYLTFSDIENICNNRTYHRMKDIYYDMLSIMASEIEKGENDILSLPESVKREIFSHPEKASWQQYDIFETLDEAFSDYSEEFETGDEALEHTYETILAIALEGDL